MTDTSLCSYFDPESGPTWPPRCACGFDCFDFSSGEHCFCHLFHLAPNPSPPPPKSSRGPLSVEFPFAQGTRPSAPPRLGGIWSSATRASRHLNLERSVGSVADSSLGARLDHHVTSWKGKGPSSATLLGSHASAAPRFLTPDTLVSPLISPAPKWAAWRQAWNLPRGVLLSSPRHTYSTSLLPVLSV